MNIFKLIKYIKIKINYRIVIYNVITIIIMSQV